MKTKQSVANIVLVVILCLLTGCSWFPAAREPAYHFVQAWGALGNGPGQFNEPIGIAIAGKEIFISDAGNNRIQVFSLTGQPVPIIGTPGSGPGQFDSPGGVAVDDKGRLYVADFFNHRVQFLASDGKFIRQYGVTGQKGIRAGLFNYPTDVTLLADGGLAVADAYNDRTQVFGPDGKFVRKWGGVLAINIPGSGHG